MIIALNFTQDERRIMHVAQLFILIYLFNFGKHIVSETLDSIKPTVQVAKTIIDIHI